MRRDAIPTQRQQTLEPLEETVDHLRGLPARVWFSSMATTDARTRGWRFGRSNVSSNS